MRTDIEWVAVSELAEINPPLELRGFAVDELVSFIPMADVSNDGHWVRKRTSAFGEVARGYTPFQNGDILFAKITPCTENGKGAHAVGLINGIGFGSTEFHVLRAKECANARYLYHWTQSARLRERAASVMIGSAGQQRVHADFFNAFEVPAFPLAEQRRIAEILDAADEAIRQSERVIAKLREVKKGLLHDLLTRGIDAEGKLRDPEAHPEEFKDSPLGSIPRQWEVPTVDELAIHVGSGATPRGGSKVYLSEGVVFIRSQNVEFDGLVLDDVAHISEEIHSDMARSEIFAHDVLINITGASIGRCCPVPAWLGQANVNQHVCAIRLDHPSGADATFLAAVLASDIGQHQVDILNAGSNREGLNYTQLGLFKIPWPAVAERNRAAVVIDAHDALIRGEEAVLEKLREAKHGLMDDLLTGRVRVGWGVEPLNH